MINDTQLITGVDVPFNEGQVIIHQPTIQEISYIGGEKSFFNGVGLLNFSKERYLSSDKTLLESNSNFQILMSIIVSQREEFVSMKRDTLSVLTLLFPLYSIHYDSRGICLVSEDEAKHYIDEDNYETFKQYIKKMFCLEKKEDESYNPGGDLASEIAKKLSKRKQKIAELKAENSKNKTGVLNRYISILSVGMNIVQSDFKNLTVYQLFDTFQRFQAKAQYDIYLQARMAGATGLDEVDNWIEDLYS